MFKLDINQKERKNYEGLVFPMILWRHTNYLSENMTMNTLEVKRQSGVEIFSYNL